MNPDLKCKCNHCSESISFPPEGLGQTIQCPQCGMETVLYDPTPKPSPLPLPPPMVPANFIADAKKKEEMIGSEKSQKIINSLEKIGEAFFFIGIIAATIFGFVLLMNLGNSSFERVDAAENFELAVAAAIAIGQGIIIKTLFKAAAEVIWLLAKLVEKTSITQ